MLKKWLPGLIGLSSLALLGRVAGFLREVLMASKFGASSTTDAYLTTIILFDLAVAANTSIISGTLSYLSGINASSKSFTNSLVKISWIALILTTVIALLLFPFLNMVVPLLFNYKNYATQIIIDSSKYLLILISFVISCGILSAALQLKGKLSIPGGLTIFVNGFSILSLILFSNKFGIISIPMGLLTGTIMFFIFQYFIAIRVKVTELEKEKINITPWLISTILVFGNLLLPNVIALFERYFALGMTQGTFSHYAYAGKLALLPLTIFGYAISTSLLPIQTKFVQDKNQKEFIRITSYGFLISFISAGLLVSIIFTFADSIVKIIYEHGHFTFMDTNSTSATLRIFSLGLFPFLIAPIVANIFYSLRLTRYLILTGIISTLTNILLLIIFVKFVDGSKALASAAVMSAWINLIISIFVLMIKGISFTSKTTYKHFFISICFTFIISGVGFFLFQNIFPVEKLNSLKSFEMIIPTILGLLAIFVIYSVCVWIAIKKDFPERSLLLTEVKKKVFR